MSKGNVWTVLGVIAAIVIAWFVVNAVLHVAWLIVRLVLIALVAVGVYVLLRRLFARSTD